MEPSTTPSLGQETAASRRSKDAENRLSALSSLLSAIDQTPILDPLTQPTSDQQHEMRLAKARLGLATSLFAALRSRHPATASHSLRVALGVSSWAMAVQLPEAQRDYVEVAALLHDVGKIGVPDHILTKPGKLTGEEFLLMERHRNLGREILSSCCDTPDVLDAVFYLPAWFDGTKHGYDRRGQDLPLGSRLVAIVDAYDAMTTDHVYRRAMSRERATAELFEFAGRQFDPDLVKSFCSLLSKGQVQFGEVSKRWLSEIQASHSDRLWTLGNLREASAPLVGSGVAFHERLLDSMHDGVLFVDSTCIVTRWNHAAERLTGIPADAILGQQWLPSLVRMRDDHGKLIQDDGCPVLEALRTDSQVLRRASVANRGAQRVSIDLHVAPVLLPNGKANGAAVILRDASSEVTLEERVQVLHEKATRDPLTKVANRAEFDRVLPEFVESHLREGVPCAMIICDIDHFKKINDTYGHQAGDDALILFGGLLNRYARGADLVARYGGEEFVILCADCNNATATRRADEIRRVLSEQAQPSLGNSNITASFGVTEVQGGDTAETFLRRADRALLQAKDSGRNLVVQLGTGIGERPSPTRSSNWFGWLNSPPGEVLLSRHLITVVPLNVTAEKLRGFVSDHHASIVSIEDSRVTLKIDGQNAPLMRRWSDRAVPFLIELTFTELRASENQAAAQSQTNIEVIMRPKRPRDRRRRDAMERARQLLVSLKSYLMAHERNEAPPGLGANDEKNKSTRSSKQILSYWLSN